MRHHLATIASGLLAVAAFAASWAWAQGVVLAVGALCAALVAIVAAVRTLAGLRPVRWLWRALVAEPIDQAFMVKLSKALDEWWNAPNGPGARLTALEDGDD